MRKISDYRDGFEKLLKRTLFSYPFYDKTDEELIADSMKKDTNDFEFGLFQLGSKDVLSIPIEGKVVEMKYIPLISLINENSEPIRIKLSSFIYPSYLPSSLLSKNEPIKSTYDNRSFTNYSDLDNALERHYGKRVLISTCWNTIGGFSSSIKCVKIMPINDDLETANLIRYHFKEERIKVLEEILVKPHKYLTFGPIDENIAREVLEENRDKIEAELDKLNKLNYNDEVGNYYDDMDSDYDLAKDTFDAMNDGGADYRSLYYCDDDDC